MEKKYTNFAIDLSAFAGMLILISTGLLMYFVLPPGSGQRASVWGLTRHDWGDLHAIVGTLLTLLIAVHLMMHWNWVRCIVQGRVKSTHSKRTWLAVGSLVLLMALAAAPLFAPVEIQARGFAGQQHDQGYLLSEN